MDTNAINLDSEICKQLTYQEKVAMKRFGAPRPSMSISQVDKNKGASFNRKFNTSMYNSAKWLCGCARRNAFFCFPCLLINPTNCMHYSNDYRRK